MQVKIVDAIMGSGKTTAMINHINNAGDDVKFLYITPYLAEADNVIRSCPTKKFRQPEAYGSKINGIKHLFEKGHNIVSTHALFKSFDGEIIDLAYKNNYVLIMDEVADVICQSDLTGDDVKIILDNYAVIEDGYRLTWTDRKYKGALTKYKELCDLGCIGVYGGCIALQLFPISIFKGFKEIYVLTYLFEAQLQKYYFESNHGN